MTPFCNSCRSLGQGVLIVQNTVNEICRFAPFTVCVCFAKTFKQESSVWIKPSSQYMPFYCDLLHHDINSVGESFMDEITRGGIPV